MKMANIETIMDEILSFEELEDIIAVEFEDYILEVDMADLEGEEIDKDVLAKVIHERYQGRSLEVDDVEMSR